jgi:hypothetical protein
MNNRLRILKEDRDRILNMHQKYKNKLFLNEAYYSDTDDITDSKEKFININNPSGKSYGVFNGKFYIQDSKDQQFRLASGEETDPNSETSKVKAMFDTYVDPYVLKLPTNFKGINYPWLGSDGSFNFKSLFKYEKSDPDFDKFMKLIESLSAEDKKELWKEMMVTSGAADVKRKSLSGEIPYPPLAWLKSWIKLKIKLFGDEGKKPSFDTPIFSGTETSTTNTSSDAVL